jgi:predicted small lipoprotein YifL
MKTIFARVAAFVLCAALLVALAGCGNKGPLVPPKAQFAFQSR